MILRPVAIVCVFVAFAFAGTAAAEEAKPTTVTPKTTAPQPAPDSATAPQKKATPARVKAKTVVREIDPSKPKLPAGMMVLNAEGKQVDAATARAEQEKARAELEAKRQQQLLAQYGQMLKRVDADIKRFELGHKAGNAEVDKVAAEALEAKQAEKPALNALIEATKGNDRAALQAARSEHSKVRQHAQRLNERYWAVRNAARSRSNLKELETKAAKAGPLVKKAIEAEIAARKAAVTAWDKVLEAKDMTEIAATKSAASRLDRAANEIRSVVYRAKELVQFEEHLADTEDAKLKELLAQLRKAVDDEIALNAKAAELNTQLSALDAQRQGLVKPLRQASAEARRVKQRAQRAQRLKGK